MENNIPNKYAIYRDIRYKRTYRTLGKMGPWRIVLGAILMLSVFLISGFIPQRIAAKGNFHLAEKLMISPAWMEKYKPETKAFIEAGVLYQDGEYALAAEAFSVIEEVDAAMTMETLCNLKLAALYLSDSMDSAYEALLKADYSALAPEHTDEYAAVCSALYEHYNALNDSAKLDTLSRLIDAAK